ncbi:MAG: alpha-xylosidase [Clostridia bacterium]|nr:alpha-xylosidase [Clostridia bacterium]
MKFTNGYWLMKKEISPLFAVEYADHRIEGDQLVIYAATRHVTGRGDCLNSGLLTVTLQGPAEDVIKVSLMHFEGTRYDGPFAQINEENPSVEIREEKDKLIYQSGELRAEISKEPENWSIVYYDGERRLTDSSLRNAAHMTNTETGICYMTEQLAIDVDELIYGMGERFTPFVRNGQTVEMWNEDGGTASEIAYKNIPFYITNKGYGVLVDNEGDVSFEVASEKVERIQFSLPGERLDYYVINGHDAKGTIRKYTELTGKPALPPAWSFGLWLSTSFTTDYDERTTSGFIEGMQERDIPLHVFHFDCYWMDAYEWCNFKWDPKTFPDPKGMLERYHQKGLKICVWINPYIGQKSPLFKEAVKEGYLIKKTDGSVWQTDMWQAGMGIVDFTNPKAVIWYQEKLKTLLDMGVDCFKTDFGERIPVKDIQYSDGSDPVKMHNYYTYLYNQAVFSLLERERGEGEAVLFARSATVGGQKFPVHWGGDCSATYTSMAETLRGGLSLACAGFGFWSHDISGFEQTAPADVYKRWCAFGLLSSHSRLHGSSSYRVPWLFDQEACEVLKTFVKLKCRLMPYLYRQAVKAHEEGIPMMRPMFVEFPGDRGAETLDRQYMLGDTLLVAPVFKSTGEVEYYLPKGTWVNLLTGEKTEGGCWKKEIHSVFTLPLMVRENTILTMGSSEKEVVYDYSEGLMFEIAYLQDGCTAQRDLVNEAGRKIGSVKAVRKGQEIIVSTEGHVTDWDAELLGQTGVKKQKEHQIWFFLS